MIDRPANVVFDFILDGTHNALWRPAVTDVQRVPGTPSGVGAAFKQGLAGPGGRRIDGDYEVIESKPSELIKFQVTAGPARPIGTFKFESLGSSTKVTFVLHYEPKGLAKLMDPMINKSMQSEIATLSNLKVYLEGQRS